MQQYGTPDDLTVQLAGPFGSAGSAVKLAELTLPAAAWKGAESPFFQTVLPESASVNSRIDLCPDRSQLEMLYSRGIALFTENEAGTVTVYAIGGKPAEDLTLQAAVTEVVA